MQHMAVPLQSQWLGAGRLQAFELIGKFSPSKSFSVSSFLNLSLTNLHHLLLLTNDFPLWGRNQEKWDWKYRKSEASRVGHEHLWAWDYCHLLIYYWPKDPIWSKHHWFGHDPARNAHKKSTRTHIKQLNTKLKQTKDQRIWVCMHVGVQTHIHTQWEMQLEWESNQIGLNEFQYLKWMEISSALWRPLVGSVLNWWPWGTLHLPESNTTGTQHRPAQSQHRHSTVTA